MSKTLIAYFSREGGNYVSGRITNLEIGNTEVAAKIIEGITEGKLFKIDPFKPYSNDHMACIEEAKKDLNQDARPELNQYLDNIDEYDTIILGYPNYWGTMPMHVFTFLENYDFTGKIIMPFCTHEGSGLGRSERDLKRLCPGADVKKGLAIQGGKVKKSEKDIRRWLEG